MVLTGLRGIGGAWPFWLDNGIFGRAGGGILPLDCSIGGLPLDNGIFGRDGGVELCLVLDCGIEGGRTFELGNCIFRRDGGGLGRIADLGGGGWGLENVIFCDREPEVWDLNRAANWSSNAFDNSFACLGVPTDVGLTDGSLVTLFNRLGGGVGRNDVDAGLGGWFGANFFAKCAELRNFTWGSSFNSKVSYETDDVNPLFSIVLLWKILATVGSSLNISGACNINNSITRPAFDEQFTRDVASSGFNNVGANTIAKLFACILFSSLCWQIRSRNKNKYRINTLLARGSDSTMATISFVASLSSIIP